MAVGFVSLVVLLIVQRVSELILSKKHTRWLRAHGAVEFGRSHYPYIVFVHVAFFVALISEVSWLHRTPASWWWIPLIVFILAEALRCWTIVTLGRRWTTRILVLPDAPLISDGPFRFIPHPNYLAVAIELLSVPLIFRAYLTAVVFTVLNLVMMSIRIPTENRALRPTT